MTFRSDVPQGPPPLAPHWDGGRSELVEVDETAALQVLEEANPPDVLAQLGRELGIPARDMSPAPYGFSKRIARLVKRGEGRERYLRAKGTGPDVSKMVEAVYLSALNSGWGIPWARAQLEDRANWLGRQLDDRRRSKRAGEFERFLAHQEAAARELYRERPPIADVEGGRAAIEEMAAAYWTTPGRAGSAGLSEDALFAAHVQIALACGSVVYNGSERQLAEQAGRCRATVVKANARLEALGFLQVVDRATATDAVTWRLRTPLGAGGGVPSRCPGPVAHDLFTPRGRGVGPAAAAMYAVLQEGPATTAQVAARVGRRPTVCARSLAKLHDAGVATHDAASGTWVLVPGHSLDEAVEGRPCAGTQVRRRIRHDLDRRAWTIWRAAHPRPGPGNAGPPRTTSTFAPRSQRGGPAPPRSAAAA